MEIITKFGVIECNITEVYTAMLLFQIIPATSGELKDPLVNLKLLINYLSNCIGQD